MRRLLALALLFLPSCFYYPYGYDYAPAYYQTPYYYYYYEGNPHDYVRYPMRRLPEHIQAWEEEILPDSSTK